MIFESIVKKRIAKFTISIWKMYGETESILLEETK